MQSSYDTPLLAEGTPVQITADGVWGEGTIGRIEHAYRIRFGHGMYDIRSIYGSLHTYYGAEQLTVLPEGMTPEKLATFEQLEHWRSHDFREQYLEGLDRLTDREVREFTTWSFEQKRAAK